MMRLAGGLAEAGFVIVLIATLAVTWPRVPWPLLQYGAPAAMVLAPILLYPFSRLVWLAFDLMLRPVVPNDFSPLPDTRRADLLIRSSHARSAGRRARRGSRRRR